MKPTIKNGDYHLIVNDFENQFHSQARLFRSDGNLVWTRDCLAKGVGGSDYSQNKGDTPPGLYKLGTLTITQDWENLETWYSFGKYFFDLVGLESNEERYGRSGCGVHGGGSNAPDPLAPYQQLCATYGCIRFYNKDLETLILPAYEETKNKGTIFYVSVNQF